MKAALRPSEGIRRAVDALPVGCHLHLLVDGAFDARWYALWTERQGKDACLLFHGRGGEVVLTVSPQLWVCRGDDERLLALVDADLGQPMFSLFVTEECLDQHALRLAAWTIVSVDGERYNLRLADSRILAALMTVLYPDQQQSFLGPVHRWWVLDRAGCWQAMPVTGAPAPVPKPPVMLDLAQAEALIAAARAGKTGQE